MLNNIKEVFQMIKKNKATTGFFVLISIFVCVVSGCFSSRATSVFDMQQVFKFNNIVPLAIIGSGPAGYAAGIYGVRGMVDTLIIEGYKPGGLLTETTLVENWPGEISIMGPELMKKLRSHAQAFGAGLLAQAVEMIDVSQWPYKITLDDQKEVYALSLIIATGANPKKLGIPGEETYWGSGVSSCAKCDAAFFKGEDVVVVGGGDSAAEEAMQLAPYAQKVTILVRKDKMRAAGRMQERLKGYANINILFNVEPQEIIGDGIRVTSIMLYNNQTKQTLDFQTNGVFLAIGHLPNTKFLPQGIETHGGGYIKLQGRSQKTSIPGVFAAGDVTDHIYQQASTAAGDGVKAALDALAFLTDIGYTPAIAAQLKEHIFEPSRLQMRFVPIKDIASLQEFNTAIAQKNLTIALFYTDTCVQCKSVKPIVQAAANDHKDRIQFIQINAEQMQDVTQKLFIQKVPTIVVFAHGKLIARYSNIFTRKELNLFIEQLQES